MNGQEARRAKMNAIFREFDEGGRGSVEIEVNPALL